MRTKPLSKFREAMLRAVADGSMDVVEFGRHDARAILAALEYERQRAEMAAASVKEVRRILGAGEVESAEGVAMRVAKRAGLREGTTTTLDNGWGPDHRKRETAAVVPKARKRTPCDSCRESERAEGLSVCERCAHGIYGRHRTAKR